MANFESVFTVILFSQSAWIVLYFVDKFPFLTKPFILLPVGCLSLVVVSKIVKFLLPPAQNAKKNENVNIYQRGLLYYTCCLFSWSCIVDIIFYLEVIGVVRGFIGFYLETGEPYFSSPYGGLALLFDFLWNFPLYLITIYCIDNRIDCRNVVLFLCGNLTASVFCLLLGGLSGSYGDNVYPCSWLNLPYGTMPMYFLLQFLNQPRSYSSEGCRQFRLRHQFLRYILTISLLLITFFGLLRGLAALGSPFPMAVYYGNYVEPYLNNPDKFGSAWVIFSMFFGTFLQAALLYGLHNPGTTWMTDVSIIYSSITIYGTMMHLLAQFGSGVLQRYQPPGDAKNLVLLGNLLLPITAVMTTMLCFVEPDYFRKSKKVFS